jgi:hypothetical protein
MTTDLWDSIGMVVELFGDIHIEIARKKRERKLGVSLWVPLIAEQLKRPVCSRSDVREPIDVLHPDLWDMTGAHKEGFGLADDLRRTT